MRKSDLLSNHTPYDASLARYRSFMEKAFSAQRVIRTPVEKKDLAETKRFEELVAAYQEELNKKKQWLENEVKKARDAVSKAVNESLEKICAASKPLGDHLGNFMRKADPDHYRYKPDPPIDWRVEIQPAT